MRLKLTILLCTFLSLELQAQYTLIPDPNFEQALIDQGIDSDGVPNGNYTITAQDSIGINAPTLIENLQPGLYNIQKTYDTGSTEQTMILKENN